MVTAQPAPITLDPQFEKEVYTNLFEHYSKEYPNAEQYVTMLVDTSMYVDRFQYLQSVIGPDLFTSTSRLFCSGFSTGSEMIMARQFGFGEVYGVEVDPFLVEQTQKRLAYLPGMYPVYYDGDTLPYEDNLFDVITSGHVIEHTRLPALYMKELMRVLKPHGFISLEFPNRFHKRELHTGLFSFEWLPYPLRNGMIYLLSSRLSSLPPDKKSRYLSIVTTKLQQISLGGVKRMLRRSHHSFAIIHVARPAPGIIRCIIQKQ
jgi:SAM-dependent methyltransferase